MIVRLAVQYATPVEVHLTCRFLSRSILDFEQFSIFSSQRPSQGPVDHRGHPCCSNVRCMPTEADRPLCGSEKKLGILLRLLPPGIYSPSRNPTVSRPVFCWPFFNCGSFETAVPGPPLATSVHAVLLQSWSVQPFTMERIVETFCPQTLELSLLILSHVEHSVRNWKVWTDIHTLLLPQVWEWRTFWIKASKLSFLFGLRQHF